MAANPTLSPLFTYLSGLVTNRPITILEVTRVICSTFEAPASGRVFNILDPDLIVQVDSSGECYVNTEFVSKEPTYQDYSILLDHILSGLRRVVSEDDEENLRKLRFVLRNTKDAAEKRIYARTLFWIANRSRFDTLGDADCPNVYPQSHP